MPKQALTVVVSIDVEEEGLFSGHYACRNPPTSNVASLSRMAPFIARGVRPTMFCAWSVLSSRECLSHLGELGPGAELGAHLHHWNTPPLVPNIPESGFLDSVPACQVAPELIKSKLKTLQALARDNFGRTFTSFRMGRWDMHRQFLSLLPKRGIVVDASVRPYHSFCNKEAGPDHFSAPADPYWLYQNQLLEVPLTVVPLAPGIKLLTGANRWLRRLSASVRHWGAIALLPVQHPQWLLRLTASLHASRGGSVLSLTWHSSEMHPGGAPHMPDETAIVRFTTKMMRFFDWLESNFDITYMTMTELHNSCATFGKAAIGSVNEDWRPADA